jgi:hypothetical protein
LMAAAGVAGTRLVGRTKAVMGSSLGVPPTLMRLTERFLLSLGYFLRGFDYS